MVGFEPIFPIDALTRKQMYNKIFHLKLKNNKEVKFQTKL